MSKKLIALLVFVGFLGLVVADSIMADGKAFKTPTGTGGQQEAHPWYSGGSYKRINNTSAETLISSNSLTLYGLWQSSGAATAYLTIRSTNVVDGTSGTTAFDRVQFTASSGTFWSPPFPVRLKGMTLKTTGTTEDVTVIYLDNQD